MIEKSSQNFKAVAQLQAELHLLKVEKLDVCIRTLFTNPVTYIGIFLELNSGGKFKHIGGQDFN